MDCQQVDCRLLAMLSELPYFSRLGTCLCIRLADYAAQLCGCRSTRQVDDSKSDDVSDQYDLLLLNLYSQIHECLTYLKEPHTYRQPVLEMTDVDLESHLEKTLFEMVVFDCRHVFVEYFLVDER